MRSGIVSRTATYWPLYLLERDGVVELVELGSTAAGVDALLAGRVDLAATCPDVFIARGAPVRIASGLVDRPPAWIVARPEVADLADLRGRRIATTAPAGSVSIFLRGLLRECGLGREDYREVVVGTTPAQSEALMAGRVDAAMLTVPFDEPLAALGFQRLAYVGDALGPAAFTTVNVRAGWTASDEWPSLRDALANAVSRLASNDGRARELRALADATGQALTAAPRIEHDERIPTAGLERLLELMRLEGAPPDATASRLVEPTAAVDLA
ncbi:MAG TPA: ABC transporter substrate-binding protein [Gaiellaceae bacterium]|nr:ABC transporter substrate-binding protein [Gaiellaceae bacterium]